MKKGELAKKVLVAAGVGLVIGTVMVVPTFGVTVKEIIKVLEEREEGQFSKKKVRRVLNTLKKRKLLDLKEKDGEIWATFNEEGQKLLLKYRFDTLVIPRPKEWDGKWRVVIFDIPEAKKHAREVLRKKLKELGFYQLQRSVFVYPFECQHEIELITRVYEIESYVDFLRAEYLDEIGLEEKFNLRKGYL